jgi:hypothetical protein
LLVEENGTTDFGGALLRYYASEGTVQGHHVHVLGMNEAWGRELPGLSGEGSSAKPEESRTSDEKMKIAWRYERLGEFGTAARGGHSFDVHTVNVVFMKISLLDTDFMHRPPSVSDDIIVFTNSSYILP